MSSSFFPKIEFEVYCRFCDKISTAHLDRSIAENGKIVDRSSVFEYYCQKCQKTFCFAGSDLLEQSHPQSSSRTYSPKEHFFIGETIYHSQFAENGVVINKDNGTPSRILVHFPKNGLRKLIQDM